MCNERNHNICYTTTTYKVHTFKNKNKRKSLRYIFVFLFPFYMFILGCQFVIIETHAYDTAHDGNAKSSLIVQSI